MATSARARRRARGRAKDEASFRTKFPGHLIVVTPPILCCSEPGKLRGVLDFLESLASIVMGATSPVVMDMRHCQKVDPAACVLLESQIQRCEATYGTKFEFQLPKDGRTKFTLAIFGVAGDERYQPDQLRQFAAHIMRVTSGAKGEPSPGERTFEIARLAELLADPTVADRVHGALNEAADNVLSWAYGANSSNPSERWWVAGILSPKHGATFIALDRGVGIPATAPKNLGDSLQGAMAVLRRDRLWTDLSVPPADWQVLWATIRQKRTLSRLDERGKGLTNMVELIDKFQSGRIVILSGDAIYNYEVKPDAPEPKEHCGPLGYRFPGTMVIWWLEADKRKAKLRNVD